ncbi:metal ABC transporter permease [Mycolicibacterium obuense]|uniref:High-affinity zinc uptake system membrane protein ZnuB n=2 Tax=Mycolicibacterium obuense TaxID=1807 RepID=A0A0J6WI90_9MYCO|nr:High-affinity zinc uptake system membrane protein ZnuB [Mycolicibacterium obuense]TDL05084.1 metal ABC transporter permease [Mycolicibacterium obuense]
MRQTVLAVGYQHNWVDILSSSFMRNAWLGGTIVALAAGLMGYFIVVRNSSFAAHALAHIGLPGATGAVLLGVPAAVGLGVFCVGGALVIGALGKRASDRDVATGTVLAFATGLGLLFNSLATRNSSTLTNVLFGNLLAITAEQLAGFLALLVVLGASIAFIYRPLLFTSVNSQVAEARGVPVRSLSIVFMVLLGITVTMAVQAVGTLLLFALVVTPAATALTLTARPVLAMAVSAAIGLLSVWVGLAVSAMFNLPPSFVVVSIACGIWLVTWTLHRLPRRNQMSAADRSQSTNLSEHVQKSDAETARDPGLTRR